MSDEINPLDQIDSDSDIDEKREAYAMWLAIPKSRREDMTGYGTQKALARDVFGCSPVTLSRWKDREDVQRMMESGAIQKLRDAAADAIDKIKRAALETDSGKRVSIKWMKLYLEMARMDVEHSDVRAKTQRTGSIQDDDTEEIAKWLAGGIAKGDSAKDADLDEEDIYKEIERMLAA